MFASFKYAHDEHIPDANYALVCVCVCILLIYEVVVKVDNVIVRATGIKHKLAHSVCTLAIEIILSFRSPYSIDYKLSHCVHYSNFNTMNVNNLFGRHFINYVSSLFHHL